MVIKPTKDSVDLGIVTRDLAPMVAFYRDTLGFTDMGEAESIVGTMHRLGCGTSHIKLVRPSTPPPAAPPGAVGAASGARYWTLSVPDLAEAPRACDAAARPVVLPPTVARPGVTVAMVEDPDGNWVEFLQLDAS